MQWDRMGRYGTLLQGAYSRPSMIQSGDEIRLPWDGSANQASQGATRSAYASGWMEWRAALSVLLRSMAMVIGPTPPGTGVMAAAFSATDS